MKKQPSHDGGILPASLEGAVASVIAFRSLFDDVPEEGQDDAGYLGFLESVTFLVGREI
jgi:hypothetical protein